MNNNEEPLPILECEVRDAIMTLNNGKSPGLDYISSELLKHGVESLLKNIHNIMSIHMETKKSDQWTILIIPIPKKGDSRK